jgi:hypothetical protein
MHVIVRIVAAHRGGDRGVARGERVGSRPSPCRTCDKVSALNVRSSESAPSRRRERTPPRRGPGEPEAPPGRRRRLERGTGRRGRCRESPPISIYRNRAGRNWRGVRGSIRGARTSRSFENSGARRSDARADSPVLESIISQHRVIPSPASVSFSASAVKHVRFPEVGEVRRRRCRVLWFSGFNPGTSLMIIASVLTLPFQLPCPL